MSGWISGAALVVSAAGTAYSIYGSERAAGEQRKAAAENARLQKLQAKATAAVQRFQARLNYDTAIAQAQVYTNNAVILRDKVKTTETEGFETLTRMLLQDRADTSATKAAYAAGGVQTDTGSPLVVEAYNAGIAQMARMDEAYKTNVQAQAFGYEAAMSDYQSSLTKELAKQYKYAEAMADWTEKTGVIAANAQHMASNAQATASQIAGYGAAASNFASSLSSFASTWSSNRQPRADIQQPVTNNASIKATQ
jgi:hypothetical protein